MRGVVAIVVGLGAIDSETAIENVLEIERGAVGEYKALKRGRGTRLAMTETGEFHRSSVAKVQDHRTRTDSHRLRIEAFPEDQHARLGSSRIVEDLIARIAGIENIRVLTRTSYEDVIARAAHEN